MSDNTIFFIFGLVFFAASIFLYVMGAKTHTLHQEVADMAKVDRVIATGMLKEVRTEWRKIAVAMAALEAQYGPRFEVLIPETARNAEIRNAFVEELELIREEIRAVQSGKLPGEDTEDTSK